MGSNYIEEVLNFENIGNKLGFIVIDNRLLDQNENPKVVDLILDFLSDCKILREEKLPEKEAVRFLVENPKLPNKNSTIQTNTLCTGDIILGAIPYYTVVFEATGEYYFQQETK